MGGKNIRSVFVPNAPNGASVRSRPRQGEPLTGSEAPEEVRGKLVCRGVGGNHTALWEAGENGACASPCLLLKRCRAIRRYHRPKAFWDGTSEVGHAEICPGELAGVGEGGNSAASIDPSRRGAREGEQTARHMGTQSEEGGCCCGRCRRRYVVTTTGCVSLA